MSPRPPMSADDLPDAGDARPRPRKAPSAFRTISEVADELHIPQHVLRFWETKFPLVKPLKRGGGRRYYRPNDILLLRRISDLLYIQGYTIKGVQRLLREGGGVLADDIPPPSAAEREAEAREALLPLPGLEPMPPPMPRIREAPPPAERRAAEGEAARLRKVLSEVLIELEALRELLTAPPERHEGGRAGPGKP